MALTSAEKELLAVVRYYNEQRAKNKIAKLLDKLNRDFDFETIESMTGFRKAEIGSMLHSVRNERPARNRINELGPSKATKKAMTRIEGQLEPTGKVGPRFNVEHLSGRIAQEYFEEISSKTNKRFVSRDNFVTQKQMMAEKEITAKTASEVFSLLREDDLIEFAEPGNFRKGYVVK
jgi:hypothetical protein